MPNEFTCPSCHVRLNVQNDASAALICPRCLNEVLYPRVVVNPDAAAPAPVTSVSAQRGRAVPSVKSEVKSTIWSADVIVLVLSLLVVVGVALACSGGELGILALYIALPIILILYPIGRGLLWATAPKAGEAQDSRALRTLVITIFMLALGSVAFLIVIFTVCSAHPFRMG